MMKLNGNQKGFSLIELMVVVGIIGILAAIAVPNFQKFQAKSRQTEAKANLGGLFTAEKAFYAEWNRFYGDFRDIGFAPEGNLRYRVGFSAAGGTIPANSGYSGPSNPNPAILSTAAQFNSTTFCVMPINTASYCRENAQFANFPLPAATVNGTGQNFTAAAVSNIDADGTIDTWTIDQRKAIANTVPDVAD